MSNSQGVTENARWTQENVNLFVELMVGEVRKGNRTTQTFNKAGWRNISNEYKAKIGISYTMLQLRNKMAKLRQEYSSFKKLMDTTGFGWNSLTRTCTVDDESIWETHIQANPKWAKFKKYGLPQWPELCIIFGDTYASGDGNVGSRNAVSSNVDSRSMENMDEEIGESSDAEEVDPFVDSEPEATPIHTPTHYHNRTPNTKRKRRGNSDLSMASKAIQVMVKSRLERDASLSTTSKNTEMQFSIARALEVLETVNNVDEELYEKPAVKIMADPQWREAFISCPAHRKIIFLRLL
ncbi:L10-interacting MYB domain-containing protein-like [Telopea speciosissima]|uniref:L10-interacting MYB domain-containing protein-like n=1 Tax=Telopea speciosissima TaxID=54955 RepID=UPI001CC5B88F|nr:L10-interacting MYB domain-containing protein-like [Telopea speciosissima]